MSDNQMTIAEKMGVTYREVDGLLLPNITSKYEDAPPIGKYGMLRKTYLKNHRKVLYNELLMTDTLYPHLKGIDDTAKARVETMVQQMATQQGINEQLKASDQMAWVGAMNNIKAAAEEVVYNELIYC